jgi:hypothetical protein
MHRSGLYHLSVMLVLVYQLAERLHLIAFPFHFPENLRTFQCAPLATSLLVELILPNSSG